MIGIVTGLLAGFIAAKLTSGQGKGFIVDLFLGVVGGWLGDWLFSLLGIGVYSWVGSLVCSVVGAIVLLWLINKLR